MSSAVKCVTFGEIMLRLSPPGFERLFQSPVLQATFGGGEANVAVSLAHFGFESYYVTRVPANSVGDGAVRALRAEGVRTDFVQRGGPRLGIYFAETGASQRASAVVYDRAGASVAAISLGSTSAPPTPMATAPARIHSPAFSRLTPPVGISLTCGIGPRRSLK